MAEFEVWSARGEKSLGFEPGTIVRAFRANRRDTATACLDGSRTAEAIREWVAGREGEIWTGTTGLLLDELTKTMEIDPQHPPPEWPKSARGLGGILVQLAPALRLEGIVVDWLPNHGTAGRIVKITVMEREPA
jgi:hypothetical protein